MGKVIHIDSRRADEGRAKQVYVEKYGEIPRSKSNRWAPPKTPPPSPCHVYRDIHPAHVEHGKRNARHLDWSTRFYPGSTHKITVGRISVVCSLGCAIGISQVLGGVITAVNPEES